MMLRFVAIEMSSRAVHSEHSESPLTKNDIAECRLNRAKSVRYPTLAALLCFDLGNSCLASASYSAMLG
jgi:hypothetical protein